jgi:hypothetical protein
MKDERPKISDSERRSIGTKNESSLHRALKFRCSEGRIIEEKCGGYICDTLGPDGEAVEIQTGDFGSLKKKLPDLAARGKVRLVYPVLVNKTLELYDTDGKLLYRKKSPRKGTIWDIFRELVYAPAFVGLKRLTVELALVDATERRCDDGKGSWRRGKISIEDRYLDAWQESIFLKKKADWQRFLPLKGEFTAQDLASAAGIRRSLAAKTLYVLEKAGLAVKTGKAGRNRLFRRV